MRVVARYGRWLARDCVLQEDNKLRWKVCSSEPLRLVLKLKLQWLGEGGEARTWEERWLEVHFRISGPGGLG